MEACKKNWKTGPMIIQLILIVCNQSKSVALHRPAIGILLPIGRAHHKPKANSKLQKKIEHNLLVRFFLEVLLKSVNLS